MAQHYIYHAPVRGLRNAKKYAPPDFYCKVRACLAASADDFERKAREDGFRVIGQVKLVFPHFGEGASKQIEVMCDHTPLEKGLSELLTKEHRYNFTRKRAESRRKK